MIVEELTVTKGRMTGILFKGLHKGYSYSILFKEYQYEPECCIHARKNMGLTKEGINNAFSA